MASSIAAFPENVCANDLGAWKIAQKHPAVDRAGERHTIHSYFNACPESPDGRYVLFFSSTSPKGELGDIRIVERATAKEVTLATGVTAEDAHRAACQQWADNGRVIVYHDFRDGHWIVVAVDVASLRSRVLASDRQLGFGSPTQPWVPVYGCHWNPGPHRNLELIDLRNGEIRTAVKVEDVVAKYRDWILETFHSLDVSIFFPVVSPDGKRVFFKIAHGNGGEDFRSPRASLREGKIVFDLEASTFVSLYPQWGHPSWHSDSRQICEKGNELTDAATGKSRRFAPSSISDHPSVSPDGRLFVTDADVTRRPFGQPGHWAVAVGDTKEDEWTVIDQFDNTKGATSWRHNHPHPVFSSDGLRIYYNVSDGPWIRLMVAERNPES